MQTQIKLLLKKPSDQNLHRLPLHLVFKKEVHKKQNFGQNIMEISNFRICTVSGRHIYVHHRPR